MRYLNVFMDTCILKQSAKITNAKLLSSLWVKHCYFAADMRSLHEFMDTCILKQSLKITNAKLLISVWVKPPPRLASTPQQI